MQSLQLLFFSVQHIALRDIHVHQVLIILNYYNKFIYMQVSNTIVFHVIKCFITDPHRLFTQARRTITHTADISDTRHATPPCIREAAEASVVQYPLPTAIVSCP